MSPIETVLLLAASSYVLSQVFAVVALVWARRKLKRDALATPPLAVYPSISVITSLKGPTPGAAEAVRSLLRQDYPGELEIVFAAKDESEKLLEGMREVVRAEASTRTVKWIFPVDVADLNPRTAKIARAADVSEGAWIFATTVDTRFAPDFLRRAMEASRGDELAFVTSFPVIDRPRDLSAILEAIGLNVDVAQYFLFTSLARGACAYGGAMLFSRCLLDRAGGYGPIRPLLTDDATLARAFQAAGGRCVLSPDLAYVRQEMHSFREYWTRQVRWRMIAKYFLPRLFWSTPLAWAHLYLAVGAVAMRSERLAVAFILTSLARVAVGAAIQRTLDAPRSDWSKAWALPLYDWLSIGATCTAALKSSVRWGTTVMRLDPNGAVVSTRVARGV